LHCWTSWELITTAIGRILVSQAVEGFLAMHEWQITEIEKAIKEADAGEFATDAEVRETFRKLRK
jgi:RHH-type transcriptional regulator, rel operon repressor / antitoxin RelB